MGADFMQRYNQQPNPQNNQDHGIPVFPLHIPLSGVGHHNNKTTTTGG